MSVTSGELAGVCAVRRLRPVEVHPADPETAVRPDLAVVQPHIVRLVEFFRQLADGARLRIEQHDAVAEIGDEHVLLQNGVVCWQEVVVQLPVDLLLGNVQKGRFGIAERQLAVGDDGALRVAQLEAMEIGGLRLTHWHFRLGHTRQSQHRPGGSNTTEHHAS